MSSKRYIHIVVLFGILAFVTFFFYLIANERNEHVSPPSVSVINTSISSSHDKYPGETDTKHIVMEDGDTQAFESANSAEVIEKPETSIIVLPDNVEQFAQYDDDPETFTTQEYHETLEAELLNLKESLNSLSNSYRQGLLTDEEVEETIKVMLLAYSEKQKVFKAKRLDQTSGLLLKDIFMKKPELLEYYLMDSTNLKLHR